MIKCYLSSFVDLSGPQIILFVCLIEEISLLMELDHPFISLRVIELLFYACRCQKNLIIYMLYFLFYCKFDYKCYHVSVLTKFIFLMSSGLQTSHLYLVVLPRMGS